MIDAVVVRTEPSVWVSGLDGAPDGDDWLVVVLTEGSLVVARVAEGSTVLTGVTTDAAADGGGDWLLGRAGLATD
jgi:hypothetical protein